MPPVADVEAVGTVVTEVPVAEPPQLTPAEELRALETLALEKGISQKLLDQIRAIGSCPDQVKMRTARLRELVA